MSMPFVDRESTYPNRYNAIREDGTSEYITLERADEPTALGTPLNAETFNTMQRQFSPVNLLDNSNFRNPVNQRGETSITKQYQYFIDRWRTSSIANGISITEEGLVLDATGVSSQASLQQRIENLPDGEYTVVGYDTAGNAVCAKSASVQGTTVTNYVTVTIDEDFSVNLGYGSGFIYATAVAPAGHKAVFGSIAMYRGRYTEDTLPEYRAKGYTVELAACQRYFINNVGPGTTGFYLASGNQFRVLIPTPVTMRAIPTTVTLVKSDSIVSNVSGQAHSVNVTGATVSNVFNNGVTVTLTTASSPGAYVPGTLYSEFNLALAADL